MRNMEAMQTWRIMQVAMHSHSPNHLVATILLPCIDIFRDWRVFQSEFSQMQHPYSIRIRIRVAAAFVYNKRFRERA